MPRTRRVRRRDKPQFLLRLRADTHAAVAEIAALRQVPVNLIVQQALDQFLAGLLGPETAATLDPDVIHRRYLADRSAAEAIARAEHPEFHEDVR